MIKKKKSKSTIIWTACFVLIVANVLVGVGSVVTGTELSELERKHKDITREIGGLESMLISDNSLAAMEEKSDELGFGSPSIIIYMNGPESFASLR